MADLAKPTSLPLQVISRSLAALLGGYALSVALPLLIGLILPVDRAEGTLTALMLSFVVYTCAFLWAFAVRDHWRAWAGLLLPALVCGGVAWSWLMLVGESPQ